MKLSVSIMAHPDRVARVDALQAALGAPVPVAWDTEGPPWRDPERLWRTARRAWELHNPHADWHLLLQDDAIVAPDLLGALGRGLKHVPERAIVSLYIGTGRPVPGLWRTLAARADEADASWIVGPRSMWGVALALPTAVIPQMMAWADRQRGIPDDMRVGRWARRSRLEAWFPWPSLVDHPEDASLLGHGPGRRALRFVGSSALEWDPAGPVVR
jgi:hypothetical protein